MAELPRGTVTLLFTDIEGSTRLLSELGSAYTEELSEHRRRLRAAFQNHGGVEVDTQGDAFFYAFERAEDALAGASAGQEALAAGPVRVRMGLHTGEPEATGEGYVGLDVHLGARVAACAHGGQVVVSKRTRDLVGDGYAFRDLGEHRLKDIEEAVWLYQLGDGSFPPLTSLSNTNLPTPASSFLGREAELAEARALLRETRLLTISGPGGTGKTRFAIELASGELAEFPNGVFWVPLAPLRDPAVVLDEAASALGAKDGLPAHIGDRRMLLLFDNFEQVVDAAHELPRLLARCPNLRVLVTSRETLRVEGETEYPLLPLFEDEGVALFCARARVAPSPAVRELCLRLDLLPLAIELAAARAKAFPPEELLGRLSQSLDLLRGGRDADVRHATLRTTIAWSYDLLSTEEQALFARLSVFAGGCTLEAAEDVCAADVDSLHALLDKSLLRRTENRYWMLETIRDYASERLARREDGPATVARHTEHFLRVAEEAYRHFEGPDQREWFERLDPEHDNLRAAIAHAANAGEREVELRLALAVAPFRTRRGYLTEGRLDLERALAVAGHPELRARGLHHAGWMATVQGLNDKAEAHLAEGLTLARELDDHELTARLLLTLAGTVSDRDEEEAQALYDELRALVARYPEERFPAAFLNLADFALRRGDCESARDFSVHSIDLFRERGDVWGLAVSFENLGLALLGLGQTEEALEQLREALRLHETIADTVGIAAMLSAIAAALMERGQTERAVRLLAAGERLFEETEAELTGFEAIFHEQTLARARAECADLEADWSRGRAMSESEALAEALEGDSFSRSADGRR